jgi:Holliday junction resolvase
VVAADKAVGVSGRRKATDQELLAAYEELRNVHLVGERFGMHGSSAHERLTKLGVVKPIPKFTDAERERLLRDYVFYRRHGRVAELAAEMGRTTTGLSRIAGQLGLTTHNYEKEYAGRWKYMGDEAARVLFDAFKASPLTLGQWCAKFGYDNDSFRKAVCSRWPDEWEPVIESKAPLSTKYRLGRQVEYRVRDYLRANGYVAFRSPASKSPVDIIGLKPGQVLLIQCKRGGSLPPAEWNALYDMALACGATPVMAETPFPRELRFWRLTARKDGSKRRQPMEPFSVDEIAAAVGGAA